MNCNTNVPNKLSYRYYKISYQHFHLCHAQKELWLFWLVFDFFLSHQNLPIPKGMLVTFQLSIVLYLLLSTIESFCSDDLLCESSRVDFECPLASGLRSNPPSYYCYLDTLGFYLGTSSTFHYCIDVIIINLIHNGFTGRKLHEKICKIFRRY